jgi:LysR family transcriptional regulator, transcriptional activator of nhaA
MAKDGEIESFSGRVINFNHLYYFHVVASEGSVARASERLGVKQPTISEQVKTLERAFGVALFERTTSGLRLTEAGRIAYEHAAVMFRQGERLVEALGKAPLAGPRLLRVGLSTGVIRSMTASCLSPIFGLDDCITSVRTAESTELLRALRDDNLDLVVTETEPADTARNGFVVVTIDRPQLVAVAHPSVVPAKHWENVAFINYRPGAAFHRDVQSFLEAKSLRPRVVAEADDALLLLEVASSSALAAIVPLSLARDSIARGRVSILAILDHGHAAVHAIFQQDDGLDSVRKAVDRLVAANVQP